MTKNQPLLIDAMTIDEWDRKWDDVPGGLRRPQPQLRHTVGLYRLTLRGQIMALGTAVDRSRGIAKRLADLGRNGDSGRNHHAGKLIFKNLDVLELEVLETGGNVEHAREIARQLRTPMIQRHHPVWTVQNAPYSRK